MTRVELRDAKGSLSEYTRKARRRPVIVTRRGRPVACEDYEAVGGTALEEVERKFALPPRPGMPLRKPKRRK